MVNITTILMGVGVMAALCVPLASGLIWLAVRVAVLESRTGDHDEIIDKQAEKMDEILKGMNEIKSDMNMMTHKIEPVIKRIEKHFIN